MTSDLNEQVVRRFKPYPEYKDSGNEWLGKYPKPWKLKPLKYVASYNDEVLPESTAPDFVIQYVDISSVCLTSGIQRTEEYEFEKAPSRARRKVRAGDTIISTVRTYLKAIAPIKAPPENMIVSTGFVVIRPGLGILERYLTYQLQNEGFIQAVVANSVGVSYPGINASLLVSLPALLPSTDEQNAIANFLDRETARIDELIAKKQRLIDLLQEKRTALISQAVTKGLNPHAPMKDSGINWLGKIPAHWEILRVKRLAKITYGVGGELDRTLADGLKIFSLPNVRIDGELLIDEIPYVNLEEKEKEALLLKPGNLLFNWRNGSADHLGKTAYFNLEGNYTHVSFLLRIQFVNDKAEPRYFYRLLNGMKSTGFFAKSKAGVNNTFNKQELDNLQLMLPPSNEQREIFQYIENATKGLEEVVKKISEAIFRLQEYRTALVSAAVTGKIDVRHLTTEAVTA